MADGHFGQERQVAEHHEIVEVKIVACVDRQAERVRKPCTFGIVRKRTARGLRSTLERPREGLRVQLDPIGASGCRPPNGIGVSRRQRG